ncbi:hypothetical protein W823_26575 [Williamsia sp. D3]|nr:hypothetical protein W823_26575 [Williamsia sp. D3]
MFGRRGADRPHRCGRFPLVQIGRSVSGSWPGAWVQLQLRIGAPTQLQLEQLVQQFRIVQFGEFLQFRKLLWLRVWWWRRRLTVDSVPPPSGRQFA